MTQDTFAGGKRLLGQPVMPLVSMLQFLFMTGPFVSIAEVIRELPEPIETDRACYEHPRELLQGYLDILIGLEMLKHEGCVDGTIVDENNNPVDPVTAGTALMGQQVLTRELEAINSQLCAPCGCTLCCTGPDQAMAQEFFEIPLSSGELKLFPVPSHDSEASRCRRSGSPDELMLEDRPFYLTRDPNLVHWQNGWSLIMPKGSSCPNLEVESGRCRVYVERPEVCRRPQIFAYMVEPYDADPDAGPSYRIRQSLLAITDCPYVSRLRDEIAEYAAASELHLVFNRNKA